MNKLLWLIVVALAVIVLVGLSGHWAPGSGGSHRVPAFPGNGTDTNDAPAIQPDSTANRTAKGGNTSDAANENLERMQVQGIAPPCKDIQKNCNVSGPVPAVTYTQAELIEVNTVPASTAEQIARIASAGACGSNISDGGNLLPNNSLSGEPIAIYDINGTKLYYRFSFGDGNRTCIILVKANKLLGSPLFSATSNPDCMAGFEERTALADKIVLADHPGYRIVSSLPVFYRDDREGIQYLMANPETNARERPVLDLCSYDNVTKTQHPFFHRYLMPNMPRSSENTNTGSVNGKWRI